MITSARILLTKVAIWELDREVMPHPPYLALPRATFEDLPPDFFRHVREKLTDRWKAIINGGGEHILISSRVLCLILNFLKTPRTYASIG